MDKRRLHREMLQAFELLDLSPHLLEMDRKEPGAAHWNSMKETFCLSIVLL